MPRGSSQLLRLLPGLPGWRPRLLRHQALFRPTYLRSFLWHRNMFRADHAKNRTVARDGGLLGRGM